MYWYHKLVLFPRNHAQKHKLKSFQDPNLALGCCVISNKEKPRRNYVQQHFPYGQSRVSYDYVPLSICLKAVFQFALIFRGFCSYTVLFFGWETWNRTKIHGFKGRCPTIRRSPNLLKIFFKNLRPAVVFRYFSRLTASPIIPYSSVYTICQGM